jgi:hypothetical protein
MAATNGQVDWYDILGVSTTAGQDEIKAAYRTLVKRTHPDSGGNAALFRLVEEAYATLSDPERRDAFDQKRTSSTPQDDTADRTSRTQETGTRSEDEFWKLLNELGEQLARTAAVHHEPAPVADLPAVEKTSRTLWLLRAHAALFAVAAGVVWHLSRVMTLPRTLGGRSAATDLFERAIGGSFTPGVVVALAALCGGMLLWRDNWMLAGRLPGSQARWALSGGMLAFGALCEAAKAPPAIAVVAASTIAGYAVGAWRAHTGAGQWCLK